MTHIGGGNFGVSPFARKQGGDNFANGMIASANGMQNNVSNRVTINQGLAIPPHSGHPNPQMDRIGRLERAVDQLSQQPPRQNDGSLSLQELMMLKEIMNDDKKEKPNFFAKVADPAGILFGGDGLFA